MDLQSSPRSLADSLAKYPQNDNWKFGKIGRDVEVRDPEKRALIRQPKIPMGSSKF
jgi:hypothetical protein